MVISPISKRNTPLMVLIIKILLILKECIIKEVKHLNKIEALSVGMIMILNLKKMKTFWKIMDITNLKILKIRMIKNMNS